MAFKEYKGLDLSKVADEVLGDWENNKSFEKSINIRRDAPKFIFYEGPPSANGMPGIHHVMARSIKDIFCRFKTLKQYSSFGLEQISQMQILYNEHLVDYLKLLQF